MISCSVAAYYFTRLYFKKEKAVQSLGCSTRQDKKEPIKGKGILYVHWAVYINASGPFLEVGLIFLIVDRCVAYKLD